ncbi:ECF RNA polymerase sigma factor SigK [Salininema proteolyticum]|uniref:ECF RNA polymerase sigma factor SigK n=1 Tax=Salininema proteolyticum TaxID=1607685 RepID=A0ABV8TUF1_9ACTN
MTDPGSTARARSGASARRRPRRAPAASDAATAEDLLQATALGDEEAFALLYDRMAPRVFGVCLKVLRSPAQAEEVAQEVLVELWRTAARFDPSRGSAKAWAATVAHRRAVDRVRSSQAGADRERRAAASTRETDYDQVAEAAALSLERHEVRRCLATLTELQRQSIVMAYYGALTYRQVAELLQAALPTVKARIRDGLARLRDCMEGNR